MVVILSILLGVASLISGKELLLKVNFAKVVVDFEKVWGESSHDRLMTVCKAKAIDTAI